MTQTFLSRAYGLFQSFWENYIKGSNGVVLMYDITRLNSLTRLIEWCHFAQNYKKDIPILLVGNKLDLEEQRDVSKDQVESFK